VAAGGAPGRGLGRCGNGRLGTGLAAGRGAPGILSADTRGPSPAGEGRGCRGPERIWPGRGAGGAGLAGIGMPRAAMGGVSGGPDDNGGRKGAERVGAGACGGACSAGTSRAWTEASTAATGSGLAATGACGVSIGAASGTCSTAGSGASAVRVPLSPSISRRLISIATGSSIELEWVFFSVTPRTGSKSRITLGLTSSSRASSLMRILIIPCAPSSTCDTGVVCFSPAPFPKSPRLPGTVQYLS
jgi:hypothetical protein